MGNKKKAIPENDEQERERKQTRERQRRTRARLLGEPADKRAQSDKSLNTEHESERKRSRRSKVTDDKSDDLDSVENDSELATTLELKAEEITCEVDIKEEFDPEDTEFQNTFEEAGDPVSEVLWSKGQKLYYDGVGFYYNQLYEDHPYRSLKCAHTGCNAMAQMEVCEGAPIFLNGSEQHNHLPNPARRDRLIFMHTIKTRRANEHTPFSVIFQQEAQKNPVVASFFSLDKIEKHLQKKINLNGSEIEESSSSPINSKKTRSSSSFETEPLPKKIKISDSPLPGNLSKKLELFKSLKDDVPFTEEHENNEAAKPSERLPGPHPHSFIYHDGNGFFYKPLSISGNIRGLKCNSIGCPALAVMALEENSPISLQPHSSPHNHPPEEKTSESSPKHSDSSVKQIQSSLKKSTPSVKIQSSLKLSTPPVKVQSSPKQSTPVVKIQSSPKQLTPAVKTQSSPEQSTPPVKKAQQSKKESKAVVEEADKLNLSRITESLNKKLKLPEKKFSERIQGPEFFYDFKGHYYFSTRADNSVRHLRCLFPTCMAEAVMVLEDNSEIQPVAGSRPHNHLPDTTGEYHSKIKQWDDQWMECLPSERLPSLRQSLCCYHDGRGYYYHQTNQADDIRYLACAVPACPVKAHMAAQKDAPITLSALRPGHGHDPDHTLRDALLFIDAVRVRHRSETPAATAIALEAVRNPVGAGRVDLPTLQICLEKSDEVDFESCVQPEKLVNLKPSTESQVPVANHFSSPTPILDDHLRIHEEEQSAKSELVPALLSDSWLYHDCAGYYYTTKSTSSNCRYLQCVSPKCGAQAYTGHIGGPIRLQRAHNHGPQPPQYRAELWFFHKIKTRAKNNPDTPLLEIYKEELERDPKGAAMVSEDEFLLIMERFVKSALQGQRTSDTTHSFDARPAEKLPSTSFSRCQYHDGQGYYYILDRPVKKSNIMHLKCISRRSCPCKAYLVDDMVRLDTKHNHDPDLAHREICLFSYHVKRRARDEDTPILEIYLEEAKKYPKAAATLREDRVKAKLVNIRRYARRVMAVEVEQVRFDDSQSSSYESQLYAVTSEVLPGKSRNIYHDGRGYYYVETFTTDNIRYLICSKNQCLAQAKMKLEPGATVVPQAGSLQHCHPPDLLWRQCLRLVDNLKKKASNRSHVGIEAVCQQVTAKEPIIAAQIPKKSLVAIVQRSRRPDKKETTQTIRARNEKGIEEGELWPSAEPCERLPSENGWVYHDGQGYYYFSHETDKSSNRRLLKCCENGCEASVWLEAQSLTRSPNSVMHTHMPEPRRRSMLLLLHRVAVRAGLEHTSVDTIYREEAKLVPLGAALIPKNKLNEILHNLTFNKYFKELEEEEFINKENLSIEVCDENLSDKVIPYEKLHSANSGKPVYCDGKGYYYTYFRKAFGKRYLKCLMPLCESRVYILLSDPSNLRVPSLQADHNHKPDLFLRNKLVFIHNLRQRVINEGTSVDIIYSEECEREPFGADLVNEVFIKSFMHELRKSKSTVDHAEDTDGEHFSEEMSGGESIGNDIGTTMGKEIKTTEKNRSNKSQSTKNALDFVRIIEPNINHESRVKGDGNQVRVAENYKNQGVKHNTNSAGAVVEKENEYTEEEYLEEEWLEEELPAAEAMKIKSSQKTEKYLPTEKLPCRSNKVLYYNGEGYYFHYNGHRDNVMYMMCVEPRCKVRGVKVADKDDAPIIPTRACKIHNHRPDFERREQLLFQHRCKLRAANETNLTVSQIWESEAAKNPDTARFFAPSNVKAQMKRYRLEHAAYAGFESKSAEETNEENTEDGIKFHAATVSDLLPDNDLHESMFYDEDIHQGVVPDKVTSLVGDALWHAAGYFYSTYSASETVEKVNCVEKVCGARALITLGDRGQPLGIELCKNTSHNHAADPSRRNQLLFIDRCKKRAATTLQSVEEIYYDEAVKMPDVAAQLSAVRVKKAMGVAKKTNLKKGIKVEPKETEDSGESGDYGMSELGEMANVTPAAPAGGRDMAGGSEELSPGYQYDSDYYLSDDSFQGTDKEPKPTPQLGPKSFKDRVRTEEIEYEEPEEAVDQDYTDYVTLEDEMDHCEQVVKKERVERIEGDEENNVSGSQEAFIARGLRKNTKPSELVPGKRPQTFNYHDGNGYYYNANKITGNYRYLVCVVNGCKARAFMALEPEDAPLNLTRNSPAHNHRPDPHYKNFTCFVDKCKTRALKEETPIKQIYAEEAALDPVSASKILKGNLTQRMMRIRFGYTGPGRPRMRKMESTPSSKENLEDSADDDDEMEEESEQLKADQMETGTEKTELLPGDRTNSTILYDGKGYYFIINAHKNKRRYVQCIEPRCRVRGSMELYPGAPIRTKGKVLHNHRPDFKRKRVVLFVNTCKERAMREDLPVSQIFREEAAKDPEAAAKTSARNLRKRMSRARKLGGSSYQHNDEDHMKFVDACISDMVAADSAAHEVVEEEGFMSKEDAYQNIVAEAVSEEDEVSDDNAAEEDPESEANDNSLPSDFKDTVSEDQLPPSEALPGLEPNSVIYYNGRGYYYTITTSRENVRYLKCMKPQCSVRAQMASVEGSPIVQNPKTIHNHRPNFKRKQLLLWMENARHRALTEDLPISDIYEQEAAKDPQSSRMISEQTMKTRLYNARKAFVSKFSSELEEFEKHQNRIDEDESQDQQQHVEEIKINEETEDEDMEYNQAEDGSTVYLYQPSNIAANQQPAYVDEKGFYYQQTTIRNKIRYLKCVEAGCKAKAVMGLEENSEITPSKQGHHHNHEPNHTQLTMMLESSDGDGGPIQVIYTDENGGEQVALCNIADGVTPQKRPYKQRQTHKLTISPKELLGDALLSPDVDVAAGDYYHNEDQQKYPLRPSEVIPGLRPDANNYHDGNGFYYELNRVSQNIRYLKCLIKDCKARAYMEIGKINAPIIQTNFAKHNHGPDLSRKQFTVFLHRVTRRAAEEDTPINVIYQQEAERDPKSASLTRMENLKQRMMRFRKKHRQNKAMNVQDTTSASETDWEGSIYHFLIGNEDQELEDQGEENVVDGREEMVEDEGEVIEDEGEQGLYEGYVVSEVEIESQQ